MADLSEIVVVNESRDESVAGDVTIFRNAEAACRWLENWWVQGGEGSAFAATGDRLTLGVDDRERVVLVSREPTTDGAILVQNWLRATAGAILQARRASGERNEGGLGPTEQEELLPTSVEKLVAYIGFTE